MTKINFAKVILGGLLAGLILNIGDYLLHEQVFAEEWIAAMAMYNMPMPGSGAIAWFVIMDFIMGIAMVWLYAAIRPRFGAGVRTGVVAGIFVWFLGWFWHMGGLIAMGIYPQSLMMMTLIWGFIQLPVAAVAGAWVYKE